MSINEALNILGLNSNFSEKELKRAYYALVKKYHPDQFEKSDSNVKIKAAEELKIINLAYEQLLEYKKFFKNPAQIYADMLSDKLQIYKSNLNFAGEGNKYNVFSMRINLVIENFYNKSFEDFSEVDVEFTRVITNIENIYNDFLDTFLRDNGIDYANVDAEISFDCNANEFYEQLLKIKRVDQTKKYLKKTADSIVLQYVSCIGFNLAEATITERIQFLVDLYACTYEEAELQNFIDSVGNTVESEINRALELQEKLIAMENLIVEFDEKEISEEYENLKINFCNGQKLEIMEYGVTFIETMIYVKNHKDEVIDLLIENIYQSLLPRGVTFDNRIYRGCNDLNRRMTNISLRDLTRIKQLGDSTDILPIILESLENSENNVRNAR